MATTDKAKAQSLVDKEQTKSGSHVDADWQFVSDRLDQTTQTGSLKDVSDVPQSGH